MKGIVPTLSEADVVEIRRCRRAGMTVKELACRFGVTESTISRTACGRTHRWNSEPPVEVESSPRPVDPWFEAACNGWPFEYAQRRLG